ncbi:hypothetical protein P43SY_007731 [Pythium insidiosum]|uniref:Uncharacterized protein n=1 Tax=Pythium insidiosum TaxID=114742 RepID=A0AAD5LPB0_PYTIN|nr:hypothetical protein P43SY_007731 [Pythium insidiosum]
MTSASSSSTSSTQGSTRSLTHKRSSPSRSSTSSPPPHSLANADASTSPPTTETVVLPEEEQDVWDISRLNKLWEIDKELKRSLPFLARTKRSDRETPADKFLRLSKLSLPAPPVALSETMFMDDRGNIPRHRQGTQRALAMTSETKAKYFGADAKAECFAIFRKLAAQKYLITTPLTEFLDQQQERELDQQELLGSRSATPAAIAPLSMPHVNSSTAIRETENTSTSTDHRGLFSRQFTARHKFSSLCLEKDLPPCIRLIIRNYFSPEINVSHMSIGDELATVFAACLLELPMVTGLNIRNNRLQDRGIQAIIDVLVAKKDLYHIDLSENKVDGDASASLATEHEAAEIIYRLGWLNTWSPLMPDNYYELHLLIYEEREVAKSLVRLAIDEPGENWQNESFGWTREEPIPGWELNLSWLKDGGFPEKGFLTLQYYSEE